MYHAPLCVYAVPGQPEQRAVLLRPGAQTSPAGADLHRGYRETEGSAAGKEVLAKKSWPPVRVLMKSDGDHLELV